MADLTPKTINELPSASSLSDSDSFPLSSSGSAKSATLSVLKSAMPFPMLSRFSISAGKTATVSFSSSELSFLIAVNGYQAALRCGLWHLGGYATASRSTLTQLVNDASSVILTATADATTFTITNNGANAVQVGILALIGTITGWTVA